MSRQCCFEIAGSCPGKLGTYLFEMFSIFWLAILRGGGKDLLFGTPTLTTSSKWWL